MRRLFKVGSDRHDVGRVTFSWHPDGNFLASAGKNGEYLDSVNETRLQCHVFYALLIMLIQELCK
jgi:hypothetical protein